MIHTFKTKCFELMCHRHEHIRYGEQSRINLQKIKHLARQKMCY